MADISDDELLIRNRELLCAPLEDELVALNVDSGLCYGFNETAAAAWRCLEEPSTVARIAARLAQDFDVDEATCRAELTPLLRQMAREGLITVAPAA